MSTPTDRLEERIYDEFYEQNPEGDARYDLWPAVIKAKKEGLESLESLLVDVENGQY
jgi:hypothetical protein